VPFGIGTKSPAPYWSVFDLRMMTRTGGVALQVTHIEAGNLRPTERTGKANQQ